MKNKLFLGYVAAYGVLLGQTLAGHFLYFGVDWVGTYLPATSIFLNGGNPYEITTLHNPAWSLIPLIPFVLLGAEGGKIAIFFAAFLSCFYVARKFRASELGVVLFMLSPITIYSLILGNIDWLVILGFTMPPVVGLFLVLLKPQIGIGVAIYWAWKVYRERGLLAVVKTFSPVAIAMAMTFFIYGNWLTGRTDNLMTAYWNTSAFPFSVLFGIWFLFASRKNPRLAVAASPCFSPYLGFGSWAVAQLGFVDNPRITFAITSGMWMIFLLSRALQA